MGSHTLIDDLSAFLAASPTPFHAVRSMAAELEAAGFRPLAEDAPWKLESGAKHYVVRDGSALIAFVVGKKAPAETGLRLCGTHTDSPCLRVKPNADFASQGFQKIGVEVYGGVLLAPWFDRDLSLAGRVVFRDKKNALHEALVDFHRPVAVVPNLAIHLQRDVNEGRAIQKQLELPPLWAQLPASGDGSTFENALLEELSKGGVEAKRVLAHELSFYDTQKPAVVGYRGDFLTSARIDNLLSCFVATRALAQSTGDAWRVLVANDHEEVGSASAVGACGPFLRSVLERLVGTGEVMTRAARRSLFASVDNAHALHPNYPEKHEPQHQPRLNGGPALKTNANQRYATNARTAAIFAAICEEKKVPLQRFVARTDMGCGSTIGPLTATELGMPVVDLGVPTFAMHSIRETAGTRDAALLLEALQGLYEAPALPLFSPA